MGLRKKVENGGLPLGSALRQSCNTAPNTKVEVLQQKALITISDNRIQMHDLIREMGCEIVRQESIICPRRRSRLRDNEEVSNVLRQNLVRERYTIYINSFTIVFVWKFESV